MVLVQHLTYFKNISELSINETMYFKFRVLPTEDHVEKFFIKFYESDNFEKLETSFASKKEDCDKEIGSLSNGGIFKYELKKKYKSQKGVLFGVFFERSWTNYYSIKPTSIYASVYDKEEEPEPEQKEDKNQNKTSDNPDEDENTGDNGATIGIICSVFSLILIIGCGVYCAKTGKCSSNDDSYNSNSLNDDNGSEYDIAIVAVKKKY